MSAVAVSIPVLVSLLWGGEDAGNRSTTIDLSTLFVRHL